MPASCPHFQTKFCSLNALKTLTLKNLLKKNLITCCNLKCAFECCSKLFKNEASLLVHYKKSYDKIPELQKSILFPFSKVKDNNSDVISLSFTNNEAIEQNDNGSILPSLPEINNSPSLLPAERILFRIGTIAGEKSKKKNLFWS